jgi:hypothetical protein
MRFRSTVLIGIVVWCAVISLLYHCLNREERREGRSFRVGFLPVT